MLFNSLQFALFFPIVTVLYFLLPHRWRWFHLLLASCVFYAAFIPAYILILFFTIVIDYYAGIMIENAEGQRRRWFLILSLIANIGVLAVFKYYNFFIDNVNALLGLGGAGWQIPLLTIILPIGLSFHTFQAMSYTIEVYRRNQKAERHFGIYALYVMYYPQLVAGPIERPQNVLHQFRVPQVFEYERVVLGLRQMLWGLFKKVVIADRLALFVNEVYAQPEAYQGVSLWIAVVFFSFQIYCDFSGYSDIALGASRVMGIELMKNFDRPYLARTISEFWSRWHISLSTWFKDYLYISLGGNRVSVAKWYRNLFIVFMVSGFWHGANWTFIIWGALHGTYLILAIVTARWRKSLADSVGLTRVSWLHRWWEIGLVFVLVSTAWVFFRAQTVGDAWYVLTHLFSGLGNLSKDAILLKQPSISFLLAIGGIVFLQLVETWQGRRELHQLIGEKPIWFRWGFYYALALGLIFFGVYRQAGEFIYFQF